MAKPP